jgi:pSer/pThr/pTyr-binding forkhead associated (FHA) protein
MPEIWLVVRDGPDAGREWRVSEQLVIGRAGSADVVLSDPTISRRHAAVSTQGETAVVEDLDSSNGTYVNGKPVAEGSRVVGGDVIRLGRDTTVEVSVGPTGAHTPTGEPTVIEPAAEESAPSDALDDRPGGGTTVS